jgi:hypothetical protein
MISLIDKYTGTLWLVGEMRDHDEAKDPLQIISYDISTAESNAPVSPTDIVDWRAEYAPVPGERLTQTTSIAFGGYLYLIGNLLSFDCCCLLVDDATMLDYYVG